MQLLGHDESKAWDAACTLADPMVDCHAVIGHAGSSLTKPAAKTQGEESAHSLHISLSATVHAMAALTSWPCDRVYSPSCLTAL